MSNLKKWIQVTLLLLCSFLLLVGLYEFYERFGVGIPAQGNSVVGVQSEQPAFLHFSAAGGFYEQGVSVTITGTDQRAQIYYTLDGSEPTEASLAYTAPLELTETTVLRAQAYLDGGQVGELATHTYFINERYTLPVISMSTNPDNLWNSETGIYAGQGDEKRGVEWEKPIYLEFYEPDGTLGFSMGAGVRLHGNWSRSLAQKSLRIYARKEYGQQYIQYPVFGEEYYTQTFKRLLLRNSGNDWASTLFRDGLMQSLVADTRVDTQGYRPAILFLNGQYWGIHNIRERYDDHYLALKYNLDPTQVDLLKDDMEIDEGDAQEYQALLDFIASHDLREEEHYLAIQEKIDIANFIDYQIAEIYFGNLDWPITNVRYWKEKGSNGKWRWLLYDTDFGFNLYPNRVRWNKEVSSVAHNTLRLATLADCEYEGWCKEGEDSPWSTFILRSLLTNEEFKEQFITRFEQLLETNFHPERVQVKIEELANVLEPEIERHAQKWGGIDDGGGIMSFSSLEEWQENVQALYEFAEQRPAYVRQHLEEYFGIRR